MSRLLAFWLLAGSLAAAGPAAAETTTLERNVEAGERLEVRNFRGSVRIVGWDRAVLRVEASHPAGERIVLERRGSRWLLVPASWERDSRDFELRLPDAAHVRVTGHTPAVDLVVTMPAGMALVATSPHADISVERAAGPIDLTTMLGDLTVDGGGTPMRLRSMVGQVELRGAGGRTTVETSTGGIVVRESAGELRVEATAGDVLLEELRTTDLEVTTLDGDIELRGALNPAGHYQLTSHSGDVELALAGSVDAQFSVRAFRGSFSTGLAVEPPPDGQRAEFTVGAGSARVRLESFSGRIRVDRTEGR